MQILYLDDSDIRDEGLHEILTVKRKRMKTIHVTRDQISWLIVKASFEIEFGLTFNLFNGLMQFGIFFRETEFVEKLTTR